MYIYRELFSFRISPYDQNSFTLTGIDLLYKRNFLTTYI